MSEKKKLLLINIGDFIILLLFGTIVYYIAINFIEKDKGIFDFLKIVGIFLFIILIWAVLASFDLLDVIFSLLLIWAIYYSLYLCQNNDWVSVIIFVCASWGISSYLKYRLS